MHMKKKLASVLALVLLVSFAFYGSAREISRFQDIPTNEEETWTSVRETIYVWYNDEALSNYIGTAAVEFGEKYGVRVIPVLKSVSDYPGEVNSATMDAEKQTPDLYVINNDELEKMYLAGLAMEIADYDDCVTEKNYSAAAVAAVTYDGKPVAYPFYFETSALIYNKDYLAMWEAQRIERQRQEEENAQAISEGETSAEKELPSEEEVVGEDEIPEELIIQPNGIPITVDGILYFADTFDAPEGVDGVMKWDVSDIFFNYWLVGEYLVVGGAAGDDKENININNPETIDCLKLYQALNQFFFIEAQTVSYESVIQDFMDGKLVFTIGTSEVLEKLQTAREEGAFSFDYGIAPLPDVSTTLKSRALSVTEAVAVNGFSQHRELANRFASYLTVECADKLFDRSGKMSSLLSANWQDEQQKAFAHQYINSVSLPKLMEIGDLWLRLEVLFSKVWDGEEVEPLIQELEEQVIVQLRLEDE